MKRILLLLLALVLLGPAALGEETPPYDWRADWEESGYDQYADVQDEILALKAKCDDLQKQLLDQVEADDKGFVPLAKAYGIPKDDPNRDKILEEATITACAASLMRWRRSNSR